MSEICTPPIITHDKNGDELVTFGPDHTWADVVRWICEYPADRAEVLALLQEQTDDTR